MNRVNSKTSSVTAWFNFVVVVFLALLVSKVHGQSPSIWSGGGGNDNWNNPANWGGNPPVPDTSWDLEFSGSMRLTPLNDFPASSEFRNLTFDAGAGAFLLGGNALTLSGDVANNSAVLQTINTPIVTTTVRSVMTSAGGGDLLFGDGISGTGGGLTKTGPGTATLAGANTYSGGTTVSEGLLGITGSLINSAGVMAVDGGAVTLSGPVRTGTGAWTVYGVEKAVLNMTDGAAVVRNGNFQIGYVAGSSGAVNISGGTFTNLSAWSFNNFSVGHFGYGSVAISGGAVDTRGFILGGGNSSSGIGMFTITEGTVTVDNNVVVPYYPGTGVLTVGPGGKLLRTSGVKVLTVNQKGSGRGELNLIGGAIDNGDGWLGFGTGSSPASGGAGIVNLDAGSLRVARLNPTSFGDSRLNFSGATLRPSTNGTDLVPATMTSVYVNGPFGGFTGGAVVDTDGFSSSIGASLLAPTGKGVNTVAMVDGGAGYIGAPYVSIVDSGGTGFGATAIANMVDDGTGNGTLKVDSIKVTNPGVDYVGESTFITLMGGAPSVPATPGAVNTAANTSGGLTKQGEGALTLIGANTYTGETIVSGGALVINGSTEAGVVTVKAGATFGGNGTIGGSVTLEGMGSLAPGDGIGTLTLGGGLTLNDGCTVVCEINDAFNADRIVVGGSLSVAGVTTISLPGTASLEPGDYTLMEISGALGGAASNFSVESPAATKIYTIVYASGAPNRVVLHVETANNLLTWTGGANNVWQVGGPLNWIDLGSSPSAFNDDDPVIFDNQGTSVPVVNITGTVTPAGVSVNAAGDYTFGGAGHITGSGLLRKAGSGALTLSGANTFNGGVVLNEGTLNLNHASAPGTGDISIGGGTIDNTSGAPLTLANNNPQVWSGDFAFGGTFDLDMGTGAITADAVHTVTVNAGNLTVGGIVGAGSLTKAGVGRLTLGGANAYTGATTNAAGTMVITGSLINNGTIAVEGGSFMVGGPVNSGNAAWTVTSMDKAVLNVVDGAAIMKNGYLHIGYLAGSSGAMNVTGGGFTNLLAWGFNNFSVGSLGYGALRVSGGQVDTRGFLLGSGNDPSSMGMATISGGTVTVDATVSLPYFSGTGVLTVSSNGNLLRTGGGNLNVNPKGNGRGELNLAGGTVNNAGGTVSYGAGPSASSGGSGIVNLNAGTLTTARFTAANGDCRLNLNGATLKPSANRTDFLPATMTSVYVNGPFGGFAGGAVIDTAGFDDALEASLLAPSGEGVSSLALVDGGSGYIGEPYVSIVDVNGVGSGATAIANMVDDGSGKGTLKVASFKVTNPGVDYTAGAVSVTLIGGAPLIPATPGTATTALNTSGGLTKLGEGTLTLTAAHTYTGATVVNGGLLAIDGSLAAESAVTVAGGALGGNGSIGGPVTVQAGGALSPGTSIGMLSINNTLSLNAESTTMMEVDKSMGTSDLVSANIVNYGGTLLVTNLAGALAEGDMFQLFSTPTPNGTFSRVVVAGATGTFDPASGMLTITSLVADYPTDIGFSFNSGELSMNWPETHLGWYAQSNSVSVAEPAAWYDIPGSQNGTNLNITINPGLPQVFFRLRQP